MSKARITYRFDQRELSSHKLEEPQTKGMVIPLFNDEYKVMEQEDSNRELLDGNPPINDFQSLNQFTNDFGAWRSPFDVETERIERIIRDSDHVQQVGNDRHRTMNATEETYDSNTGYYDAWGSGPVVSGHSPWVEEDAGKARFIRTTQTPWLKLITSITGAVVVGLFFGFFVLSLFSDEAQVVPQDAANLLDSETAGTIQENQLFVQGEDSDAEPKATASAGVVQVGISAQTYFLLQNGVFSTHDGAEAAQADLRGRGIATAVELGSKLQNETAVYTAITTNRDDALRLSQQLQGQEIEIYIKPYEFPEVQHILRSDGTNIVADAIAAYFNQGQQLVKMISDLTLLKLQDNQPIVYDLSTLEALKKEHLSWTVLAAPVLSSLPEDAEPVLHKMNNRIQTAVVSIEEYNRNPSFAHLWQAQSALMEYVIMAHQLLAALAV